MTHFDFDFECSLIVLKLADESASLFQNSLKTNKALKYKKTYSELVFARKFIFDEEEV